MGDSSKIIFMKQTELPLLIFMVLASLFILIAISNSNTLPL